MGVSARAECARGSIWGQIHLYGVAICLPARKLHLISFIFVDAVARVIAPRCIKPYTCARAHACVREALKRVSVGPTIDSNGPALVEWTCAQVHVCARM